jgi:hypothetical protein
MKIFYNPDGNAEVWDEKPEGYLSQEEWDADAPRPIRAAPTPTLDEVRAEKLAEIKRARQAAIANGEVEYDGLRFPVDSASQGALSNAILTHQLVGALPRVWKAKDGYLPVMSIGQLTAVYAQAAAFGEERFTREMELTEKVNAAESVKEIEGINWDEAAPEETAEDETAPEETYYDPA